MFRFALAFALLAGGCTDPDGAGDDDDDDTVGGDGDADVDLSLLPCSSRMVTDYPEEDVTELAYLADGRLSLARITRDSFIDGDLDEVSLELREYGDHGVYEETRDRGADCLPESSSLFDHRGRQLPQEGVTLDERGNMIRSVNEQRECTYEYDDHDNLVLSDCQGEMWTEDMPDPEPFHETVVWTWTYDAQGHEVALDIDNGELSDEHWRWTWNDAGQRIREESWQDNRTAGPEIVEWTYDELGRLDTEVRDDNGDRRETTFAYDCWERGGPDAEALACTPLRESEEEYSAVSLAEAQGCGLRLDGTMACWGNTDLDPPAGPFSALASGVFYVCGLWAEDGALECFALSESADDLRAPTPPGAFTALAVEFDYGCAIRVDGAILCWGYDSDGRTVPPEGSYTSLSLGTATGCALDAEGVATCWGRNRHGEADPPAGERFRQVDVAGGHACGVTLEGALVCWGDAPPTDEGLYSFVSVASGELASTCALRDDGTIVCWQSVLSPPEGRFTALDMRSRAVCALRDDHRLVCWGDNESFATSPP